MQVYIHLTDLSLLQEPKSRVCPKEAMPTHPLRVKWDSCKEIYTRAFLSVATIIGWLDIPGLSCTYHTNIRSRTPRKMYKTSQIAGQTLDNLCKHLKWLAEFLHHQPYDYTWVVPGGTTVTKDMFPCPGVSVTGNGDLTLVS